MSAPGRSYDLHGLHLAVTGWAEAVEALHARLAGLPARNGRKDRDGSGAAAGLEIELEMVTAPAGAPPADLPRPANGRTVYEPPEGIVLYDDAADLLWLELGPRLRATCEPGRGRARLACAGGQSGDLWLLSHPLATLPLVEILKRRGLYSLHAAGLCCGGRGLVLAGTSGAGKSTLTIALARAGFGFLGDDTLFLARRPGGLTVLAFPDEVDVTERTVSFFPDLVPSLTAPRAGWRKRQLRAEEACGAPVVWECAPAHLVFPRVSGREESVLVPVGADEALVELAPNVLLTDPAASQAHFDALAGLAAASACWRLETGSDLDGAVRVLSALFAEDVA